MIEKFADGPKRSGRNMLPLLEPEMASVSARVDALAAAGHPLFARCAALHAATLAARERTGDDRIGTSVEQGMFRVELVEYQHDGTSRVTTLAGPFPEAEAVDYLNCL